MSNKNWNQQTAAPKDHAKPTNKKGCIRTDARPNFKEMVSTKPSQKPLGGKCKSKKEMIDVL